MASIPYMPLYIADYMADAAHLSTLEHGAYLLLIMTYWQRGKPLPNSNERLANVARMSSDDWQSIRPVLQEFFEDDGTYWRHKRIEKELHHFRDKSAKASAAGKASAERRISKRSTDVITDVQRTCNHTDTDTDTDTDTEKIQKEKTPRKSMKDINYTPEFEDFWNHYPRKENKSEAFTSYSSVISVNPNLQERLILSAKAFTQSITAGTEKRFIAHGSTWLNKRRWENDYSSSSPLTKPFKNHPSTTDPEYLNRIREQENDY